MWLSLKNVCPPLLHDYGKANFGADSGMVQGAGIRKLSVTFPN